jgi:hypothetical protein
MMFWKEVIMRFNFRKEPRFLSNLLTDGTSAVLCNEIDFYIIQYKNPQNPKIHKTPQKGE